MRTFDGYEKGVDLGGWLSQCGKNYTEEHYSTFITQKDIDRIASWGCDHVRLPVDYNVVQTENGEFIESGFRHIDDCIRWCKEKNMKIVLDLHKTCGYVFDDASYCSFFTDERLQEMFISLWMEFARRYKDNPDIAFELLNEVTDPSTATPWNRIAAKTIQQIRSVTATKKIVIGGIYNSSIYGLTLLDAPVDENIVFTFHCYSPMVFTHQDAPWVAAMPKGYRISYPLPLPDMQKASFEVFGPDFDGEFTAFSEKLKAEGKDPNTALLSATFFEAIFADAIRVAEKYNVPLYCGEYGVIERADRDSTLAWYQSIHAALDAHKIARSAWSYKQMDFGIVDSLNDNIRDEIIKCL